MRISQANGIDIVDNRMKISSLNEPLEDFDLGRKDVSDGSLCEFLLFRSWNIMPRMRLTFMSVEASHFL